MNSPNNAYEFLIFIEVEIGSHGCETYIPMWKLRKKALFMFKKMMTWFFFHYTKYNHKKEGVKKNILWCSIVFEKGWWGGGRGGAGSVVVFKFIINMLSLFYNSK